MRMKRYRETVAGGGNKGERMGNQRGRDKEIEKVGESGR